MDKYHEEMQTMLKHSIKNADNNRAFVLLKNDGKEKVLNYNQILSIIEKDKNRLFAAGIVSGCRVAIIAEHSPYTVLLNLVLAYIGVKAVLIDSGLPDQDINKLVETAEVSGVFLSENKRETLFAEKNFEVPAYLLTDDFEFIHMDSSPVVCKKQYSDSDEDIIAIIFSSGTTGVNKGVEITYRSVLHTAKWFHDYNMINNKTRHLDVIPSNHIAGYTTAMACNLLIAEVDFIEEINSATLLNAMSYFNPSNFVMIPKIYEVIMEKIKGELGKKSIFIRAYAKFAMKISSFVRKKQV